MPRWKIHRKIYELVGITGNTQQIDRFIDFGKADTDALPQSLNKLWSLVREELTSENRREHDLYRRQEFFYLQLGVVKYLYGKNGINVLFVHYLIDFLTPFMRWAELKDDILAKRFGKANEQINKRFETFLTRLKNDLDYNKKIMTELPYENNAETIQCALDVYEDIKSRFYEKKFEIVIALQT